MNITKILFSIIAGVIITTPTLAANTMCVTDDMETVVLDPSIGPSGSYSTSTRTDWSVPFNYGNIIGKATCTDQQWGYTYAHAAPEKSAIIDTYPLGNTPISDNHKYCWCKMIDPVQSAWVFNTVRETAADCVRSCASSCGYAVANQESTFREALFSVLGM